MIRNIFQGFGQATWCPIDVCIIIAHEVVVVDAFLMGSFGCLIFCMLLGEGVL
jgi:hypothetical protein